MSKAIYCDRCHQYSKDDPYKASSPNGNWTIDLCSDCFEQYKEWIKGGALDATNKR